MTDCPFCSIVDGDLPSHTVYEDDQVQAFLDANPFTRGHVLVIPKDHHRWVWDMDDEETAACWQAARKVANAQRSAFGTDWVVSEVIGEEVPHAHIHLVPRYDDDGHGANVDTSVHKDFSEDEMEAIAAEIRGELE